MSIIGLTGFIDIIFYYVLELSKHKKRGRGFENSRVAITAFENQVSNWCFGTRELRPKIIANASGTLLVFQTNFQTI